MNKPKIIIAFLPNENSAQEAMLIDNEGPDFAVYQIGKRFTILTRSPFSNIILECSFLKDGPSKEKGLLKRTKKWSISLPNFQGLWGFSVNTSKTDLLKMLQEVFPDRELATD